MTSLILNGAEQAAALLAVRNHLTKLEATYSILERRDSRHHDLPLMDSEIFFHQVVVEKLKIVDASFTAAERDLIVKAIMAAKPDAIKSVAASFEKNELPVLREVKFNLVSHLNSLLNKIDAPATAAA